MAKHIVKKMPSLIFLTDTEKTISFEEFSKDKTALAEFIELKEKNCFGAIGYSIVGRGSIDKKDVI